METRSPATSSDTLLTRPPGTAWDCPQKLSIAQAQPGGASCLCTNNDLPPPLPQSCAERAARPPRREVRNGIVSVQAQRFVSEKPPVCALIKRVMPLGIPMPHREKRNGPPGSREIPSDSLPAPPCSCRFASVLLLLSTRRRNDGKETCSGGERLPGGVGI